MNIYIYIQIWSVSTLFSSSQYCVLNAKSDIEVDRTNMKFLVQNHKALQYGKVNIVITGERVMDLCLSKIYKIWKLRCQND